MSPRENHCRPKRNQGWQWFSSCDYSQCCLLVQDNNNIIISYRILLRYIVYITTGLKTIQVKWIFVLVHSNIVHSNPQMTPVRIYGKQYAHQFCAVDIPWNFTPLQIISTLAKSHHVLERDFMIQRDILMFIICFSANQNQRIYMNEWYYRITNTSSKIFSRSINFFWAWCKFCLLTSLLSTANFSFVETISSHSFRCCPKYLLFQNKQWQSLTNFFLDMCSYRERFHLIMV